MTEKIEDPRPLPKFDCLPNYAKAWRRWGDHADVARTLIFLGVKLTDADYYRSRLAHVEVKRLGIPEQRAFSRNLDAFVFVIYGALDSLCHIVAQVAETQTKREIKFPLITSILAEDVRQPDRWSLFIDWIEQIYLSSWYIDVRRLRNVINYGSVLSAPLTWPPDAECVTQWLASYDHVIDTVEHSLALLLETDA